MIDNSQVSPATYVQVSCLNGTLAGRLSSYINPAPQPLPHPFVLGRGEDCHLCFKGRCNVMVSRRHAELRLGEQGLLFRDCSSQGSYLAKTQERISLLDLARGEKAVIQLGPGGPRCEIASGIAIPFGNYSLVAKLGEGGMAEVYLASAVGPEGFAKEVVIKVVRSFLANDQQFIEFAEALAARGAPTPLRRMVPARSSGSSELEESLSECAPFIAKVRDLRIAPPRPPPTPPSSGASTGRALRVASAQISAAAGCRPQQAIVPRYVYSTYSRHSSASATRQGLRRRRLRGPNSLTVPMELMPPPQPAPPRPCKAARRELGKA